MLTYHQLNYSSPNCSKKPRATQKSLPFRKLRFRGKDGPTAEKDKTERVTGLGRNTREQIYRKVGSNWRPWDPDRGETSEIPSLPLGVCVSCPQDIVFQRRKRTVYVEQATLYFREGNTYMYSLCIHIPCPQATLYFREGNSSCTFTSHIAF